MRKYLLLSFLVVFFISCNSKKNDTSQLHREGIQQNSFLLKTDWNNCEDHTFQFHLEGIRYDSLSLICVNKTKFQGYRVNGESADGSNWTFLIPDSVYRLASNFFFDPKLKGEKSNIRHRILFLSCQNGDTLNHSNMLPLDRKIADIYAKYLDTEVFENTPAVDIVSGDDTVFFVSLHSDHCEILSEINSDFELRGKYLTFPYISSYREDTYDNYITQCLNIIGENPDSRYLIGCVAENRTAFHTKESLQKIYAAFSKENQQSDFGKIIDKYLQHFFVFSNIKLLRYDNSNMEYLIQDSTKMNLIVFSASWCAPCHKLIPALKEIYKDLKSQLDITYISMDEEKTSDNWRKLMKEQAIPWRSLMAKDNIKSVQEKYNLSGGIPFTLLVYPDKTVEIIDIRQDDQREKLYSVCKNVEQK